jgi:membrane protein implicated in regulation of membrane protease activity
MDFFSNAAITWFVIGFIFFLLEFALPGFILFFFGVGAWTASVCVLFFPVSLNAQLLIFLFASVLSLLLFRKYLSRVMRSRSSKSEISHEFIGKTALAQTDIGPGKNGKVEFHGTSWDARSDEMISPGEKVTITGNESILLHVKPQLKS